MGLSFARLVIADATSMVLEKRRWIAMLVMMAALAVSNPLRIAATATRLSYAMAFLVGATASSIAGMLCALSIVEERSEGKVEYLAASSSLGLSGVIALKLLSSIVIAALLTVSIEVVDALLASKGVATYALVGLSSAPMAAPLAVLGFLVPRGLARFFPALVAIALSLGFRRVCVTGLSMSAIYWLGAVLIGVAIALAVAIARVGRLYELAIA